MAEIRLDKGKKDSIMTEEDKITKSVFDISKTVCSNTKKSSQSDIPDWMLTLKQDIQKSRR